MRAGKSDAIEMPFIAWPQPKIEWSFKGKDLPDTKRFRVSTTDNFTSITLSKVIRSDAGDYKLALENPYGRVEGTIKLQVLGTFIIYHLKFHVVVSAKYGIS